MPYIVFCKNQYQTLVFPDFKKIENHWLMGWAMPENLCILLPKTSEFLTTTNESIIGNISITNNTNIKIFFYEKNSSIFNIILTICSTQNLGVILTIGRTDTYEKVNAYLGTTNILHVHIPMDIEYKTGYERGIILSDYSIDYVKMVIRMTQLTSNSKLAVFYSSKISRKINIFLSKMTAMATINMMSLYLFDYGNSTASSLASTFATSIKLHIHNLLFFTNDTEFLVSIINMARTANILQQNYYWIIDAPNLDHMKVLSTFQSSDKPSFTFIRSALFENFKNCNSNCSVYHILLMNVLKIILNQAMNTELNFTSNNTNDFSCSSGSDSRDIFNNLLSNNADFQSLISNSSIYNLFSTQSVDTTFDKINTFTYSTIFTYSGQWSTKTSNYFKNVKQIFPNVFDGWENKTLFICAPVQTPGMAYIGNGTSYYTIDQTVGLIPKILTELSSIMSFRMLLYQAADMQFGAIIANTTNFTGCLGQVLMGNAMFSAGSYTYNYQRDLFADFTFPIMEESNSVLLRIPQPQSKIWDVYRPLQWTVWLSLVFATFVMSGCCCLIAKNSPFSAWNLKLNFAIMDEVSLNEHLWNAIGAFFLQGQDFYPYAMSARTVIATWWFFALIICCGYVANLTSFLTVTIPANLLSTLDHLAARTDIIILLPNGTNVIPLLGNSTNPIYQKLFARSIIIDSVQDCTNKVLDSTSINFACITDASAVTYFVNSYCSVVYSIAETFNTAPLGFVTAKDVPFKLLLDQSLRSLGESGYLQKLIKYYWKPSKVNPLYCNTDSVSSAADPINLEQVLGVLIVTWLLLILAFLIFLFELLIRKYHLHFHRY